MRWWQPTLVTQVPLEPSVAVHTELGKVVTWKMLQTDKISIKLSRSQFKYFLLKLLLPSCLSGCSGAQCCPRVETERKYEDDNKPEIRHPGHHASPQVASLLGTVNTGSFIWDLTEDRINCLHFIRFSLTFSTIGSTLY